MPKLVGIVGIVGIGVDGTPPSHLSLTGITRSGRTLMTSMDPGQASGLRALAGVEKGESSSVRLPGKIVPSFKVDRLRSHWE